MNFQKTKCAQCGESLGACQCRRRACLNMADGEPLVFIEGHDHAILGLAHIDGEPRAVYDQKAIVGELMRRDGMDWQGATEFFEYNMASARLGAGQALFLYRMG
jgi:hypothetical protein